MIFVFNYSFFILINISVVVYYIITNSAYFMYIWRRQSVKFRIIYDQRTTY